MGLFFHHKISPDPGDYGPTLSICDHHKKAEDGSLLGLHIGVKHVDGFYDNFTIMRPQMQRVIDAFQAALDYRELRPMVAGDIGL